MKTHRVELRLGIWGFEDIAHEKLTELIGVKPIKDYFKDKPVNKKLPNGKISDENGWLIAPPESLDGDDFETQMDRFIDLAEERLDIFNALLIKYHCEFSCAIFIEAESEESTPWIHLGDRYNKVFGKLNVHFDLDIYQ
jgi:hypothetical protein